MNTTHSTPSTQRAHYLPERCAFSGRERLAAARRVRPHGDRTKRHPDGHIFLRRESRVRSYCRHYDAVFDAARGSLIWDTDGPRVPRLPGRAPGSLNYGHNDPDMAAALDRAHPAAAGSRTGWTCSPRPSRRSSRRSKRLVLLPRGLDLQGAVHRADRGRTRWRPRSSWPARSPVGATSSRSPTPSTASVAGRAGGHRQRAPPDGAGAVAAGRHAPALRRVPRRARHGRAARPTARRPLERASTRRPRSCSRRCRARAG